MGIDEVLRQSTGGYFDEAAAGAAADEAEALVSPAKSVRGDDGLVGKCQHRFVLGYRFCFKNIEAGTGDLSPLEGPGECSLIDYGAAGRVDEVSTFLH